MGHKHRNTVWIVKSLLQPFVNIAHHSQIPTTVHYRCHNRKSYLFTPMHSRYLPYLIKAQFCSVFVCLAHQLSSPALELLAAELNVYPVNLQFSAPSILYDHLSHSHPSLFTKVKPLVSKRIKSSSFFDMIMTSEFSVSLERTLMNG